MEAVLTSQYACVVWCARLRAVGEPFASGFRGLLRRYQRWTVRLAMQIAAAIKELARHAATRTLQVLAIPVTFEALYRPSDTAE